MPSAITTFGANAILNMLFGQRTPVPGTFYVALLTQAPGAQASGSTLTEPPANTGYARVAMTNDNHNWGIGLAGFVATTADISFPAATTGWPVITHYALCDAATGGNVFLYGSFNTPRRIFAKDKVVIPSGLLGLTVSSLTTTSATVF